MTIREAIARIDEFKPNTYTQSQKIAWLSTLDGMIYENVMKKREGHEEIEFSPYNDNTDLDTELLAEYPYDEMYIFWLESKIDYSNAEYAHYNNSITQFNDEYQSFANWYNREHIVVERSQYKYF